MKEHKKKMALKSLGLLLVLALSACGRNSDTTTEGMNWNAPGQWVLLSYWGPRCTYCEEEIPRLNEWHSQGKVAVFGVSAYRLSSEQNRQWQEKNQPIYPILAETPEVLKNKVHVQVVPTHYLLSPEGDLHGPWVGVIEAETLIEVMGEDFN